MQRVVFSALLAMLFITHGFAAEKSLILTSTEYPPYFGKDLKSGGPVSEIVVEAYRQVGYTAEIRFYPWARALLLGKEGQTDGISGIWHSTEREQWFVYSEPLMGNEIVFYKRRGSEPKRFTTFESLKPLKIGTVRGYANPPKFNEARLDIEEVTDDMQNLNKLAKNRVDLVLIDRGVARYLLTTKLTDLNHTLEPLEPPVEKIPLYLAISKRAQHHQLRLQDFNKGLNLLRQKGQLRAILAKHGFQERSE